MLIYPLLDDPQITPSRSQWPDPICPPAANTYGWTAYLGDRKGGPDVPIYAAPARATDLACLPPTPITVGAIDGYSDKDIDYAVRLRHAGVAVELHVYPGGCHGFDMLCPNVSVSQHTGNVEARRPTGRGDGRPAGGMTESIEIPPGDVFVAETGDVWSQRAR